MNIVDDADGPLDPRIQIELENLNNATDDINKLEIELDEANTAYGQLLSEITSRLKELVNKLGSSCIERARCYYEACQVAHEARLKCQHQAQLFERANLVHDAAKETVARAEECFMSHQHEWNFDQAWQDMLNHTTLKVMEAETQKAECAREHQKATVLFHDAKKKAEELEEKYRRSINKAQPYFDLKAQFDQKLAIQKEVVDCLNKAVKDAKCSYAASLRALEEISNEIHEKRRDYANGPREPGVGAELVTPVESLDYEEELNKLKISRVNSIASSEQDLEDRIQDFEDVKNLKERVDHLNIRSVDGSESTSDQWELELQASVEKLNNLSYEALESEKIDCLSNVDVKSIKRTKYTGNDSSVVSDGSISKNGLHEMSNKFNDIIQGCQSLTQSPINSLISRSKIVFKNSFSKSLTNSPLNKGTALFGKSNSSEAQIMPNQCIDNQVEKTQAIKDNDAVDNFVVKNDANTETENNEGFLKPAKSLTRLSRLDNTQIEKNIPKESHSLDSTPIKVKSLSPSKSMNFISNDSQGNVENAHESSCSSSRIKELPLLSFFQKSLLKPSKDKSCSMVDLNEKQNLKNLLDKSDLGNIQAVSVEKLASARQKLVGNS